MKELKIKRVHDIMKEIDKKMDELYAVQMLAEEYEEMVTVGEYKEAKKLANKLAKKGYPVNFEEDHAMVEKYWEENPLD